MKNSLETKLGIFVILVVFAGLFIVEILGGTEIFRGGYHLNALFDTVHELKVGDSVKMAGVEIGRVEKVELEHNKVKVTMKLRPGVVVKTDSTATILFTGLMGQNYISISFGTPDASPLLDNQTIATTQQPDLNAIMAKLDKAATGIQNMTKSLTPDTLNNLLGPLIDFVKQNSGHLGGAITNLESISAQIASGRGTVGKLIYDQSLYNSALITLSNLQDTVTEAQGTLAVARGLVSQVRTGQGTLGKLMTDPTLYNATAASMTNLQQILLKINHGQGTVGQLVNNQEFYKNAKLTLQKVDKATEGFEDQGPLSVLGIVANGLGL